jgi:hypothetical protein
MRFNRQVAEGLAGFLLLLIIAASFGSSQVFPPSQSSYLWVGSDTIAENPSQYENRNISTSVIVSHEVSFSSHNGTYCVSNGFIIVIHGLTDSLLNGTEITIRGLCLIDSQNTILVEEMYIINKWSSYFRSIPGFLLFIGIFFYVFQFDRRRIVFKPRRDQDA